MRISRQSVYECLGLLVAGVIMWAGIQWSYKESERLKTPTPSFVGVRSFGKAFRDGETGILHFDSMNGYYLQVDDKKEGGRRLDLGWFRAHHLEGWGGKPLTEEDFHNLLGERMTIIVWISDDAQGQRSLLGGEILVHPSGPVSNAY